MHLWGRPATYMYSLDIDFIDGHIHDWSCKNNLYYTWREKAMNSIRLHVCVKLMFITSSLLNDNKL